MIHLHRAERADRLAEGLAKHLGAPPADPMAGEVIAVPTRGVERWLSQRLSGMLGAPAGDGVCANVAFPFPGRLVGDALAAAAGVERGEDLWLADRLVWPLLDVVGACLTEPWLATLAAHLGPEGDSDRRARRFSSVRHIADLFDRYAVHRQEMLQAWAAGEDTDGAGRALPGDVAWQAELWRRLRGRLAVASPPERLREACARLREDATLVDLPNRVSLFGLTRLPASYLDVLAALAAHREVHLYLLHPSPALWERLAGQADPAHAARRVDDPTSGLARNPLLASWGRDAREMQLVLAGHPAHDEHRPLDKGPEHVLGRLQADVRADRPPPGAPLPGTEDARAPLAPEDRSLQVHACHGRGRQVEVVRDAILHALAEDPTLEPRDVLVMCPDVEAFAPLVHATFAASDDGAERTPDIRVRLADRSLRQTNPLLGVVAQLLDLASARLTVAQVLDLAAREPVRRRFDLDDDDLSRLERWATDGGVRWGLDVHHRAAYGLDGVDANTWRAGLDRLLAGVAVAEGDGGMVGGVLPLDDVESGAIDLAGRLAELLERLGGALGTLAAPRSVAGWIRALAEAADGLCAVAERDAWQREQLESLLDDVTDQAANGDVVLSPPEVGALLADRLRGRPTRANFRTGHLTVCTLVPMRSVPHRMICLMGLDDGAFPRQSARDGDDILALEPRVGDRDARGEDRQLLLDALMAATDRLVIAYSGRDERTNAPLPPAVPVGELLDVVEATVRVPEGSARETVTVAHPLQPFDARNFTAGALGRPGPWGFDRAALDGARALATASRTPAPFLGRALSPAAVELVALDALERFVKHPVRAFLRGRLGVSLERAPEGGDEAIPIAPSPLERWHVGTRLMEARRRGASAQGARAAERVRGTLPPGALGEPILDELERLSAGVMDAAEALSCHGADSRALEVALPDGRTLVGTLGGLGEEVISSVSFSRLKAASRLEAWVRFLALSAAEPERPWRSVVVGRPRAGGKAGASVSRLSPLGHDAASRRALALEQLEVLVDLLDRGMREPLPLYCLTSAAYAQAVRGGGKAAKAAAGEWDGPWNFDGEVDDASHALVLGRGVTFEALLEELPQADEAGPGWDMGEGSRFGRLALRLWDGLLAHEELGDR